MADIAAQGTLKAIKTVICTAVENASLTSIPPALCVLPCMLLLGTITLF